MILRMYIDDVLLRDTPNLFELKEVIELDQDLGSWINYYNDVDLVFTGDGAKILTDLKRINGYNYRARVRIDISTIDSAINYGDTLHAYIYLTDISINHTNGTVTANLIEVHFEGAIKQNKDVQVYLLGIDTSINGEAANISSFTPARVDLRLFDSATGVHNLTKSYGVNLIDAIKFSVKYITDDQINFEDRYFANKFPNTKFCLIKGRELRRSTHGSTHDLSDRPKCSFFELITNSYKLFNTWWYIDYSTVKPTFVIDSYENVFKVMSSSVDFGYIKNIEESFNQELFYTSIKIGSKDFNLSPDSLDSAFIPFVNGFTHHEEVFFGKNNTMVNNELDLVTDWIIDHNTISLVEDIASFDQYDDNLFLIECQNVAPNDDPAIPFTYMVGELDNERRYNESLLNLNRLSRFELPVDIGFSTGTTDDNFKATLSSDLIMTSSTVGAFSYPAPFANEAYDFNNNYNNVLFRYVVPFSGNYGFEVGLKTRISNMAVGSAATILITIWHKYPSGSNKNFKKYAYCFKNNTGIEGEYIYFNWNTPCLVNEFFDVEISRNIGSCREGEVIVPAPPVPFLGPSPLIEIRYLKDESYFMTKYVQQQGGLVYVNASINKYNASIVKFDKNISSFDWKEFKKIPTTDFLIYNAKNNFAYSKIKKIERSIISGQATCEGITNIDNNNL